MLFSALLSITDTTRYGVHAGSPDLQTSAIDCNKRVLERPNQFLPSVLSSHNTQLHQTLDQNVTNESVSCLSGISILSDSWNAFRHGLL
jgi:hypothetical protein